MSEGPYSLKNFFKSDEGILPFLMEVITAPKLLAVKRHNCSWCLHKPLAMFSTGLNFIKTNTKLNQAQKYEIASKNVYTFDNKKKTPTYHKGFIA